MYKKLHKVVFQNPQTGYCPQLKNLVVHGFSWSKKAGNMDFPFGDSLEVRLRVQKFLTDLNMGSIRDCVNMIPEQNDHILDISESFLKTLKRQRFGKNILCDAIFTKEKNVTLTIKPADCTTALVYAKTHQSEEIIGIIHSGRRGVEKHLPAKTVKHICSKYKCKPENILISIVPHLFQNNRRFESIDDLDEKVWDNFIEKEGDCYYPDETGFAIKQYLDSGIKKNNLEVYDVDTYEEAKKGNCFSYKYHLEMKKQGKSVSEGRFIVAIMKKTK
ncbi:MAG: laccase domain-containing protein [Candidatus Dojkabacteria bacterium]|nr:laccase domain-containing protein [Candidatus Dojkabacteria bacterium]